MDVLTLSETAANNLAALREMNDRATRYFDSNPTSNPFFNAHFHNQQNIIAGCYRLAIEALEAVGETRTQPEAEDIIARNLFRARRA